MTARTARITRSGSRRRVDLAVDATTAVGLLVPDVLRVLGEPVGTAPDGFVLTLPEGRALDPQQSLADADVRDGTTVVLSPRTEAVGAAIVHDVSDTVATDLSGRRGRWNAPARRATATLLLAVAVVAAVLLLEQSRGLPAAVPRRRPPGSCRDHSRRRPESQGARGVMTVTRC